VAKLTEREKAQIAAALRYWGRAQELSKDSVGSPEFHPMCRDRLKTHGPMTLDELETLIGKIDGSFKGRGMRLWNPHKWL
jgi:hypothetical protein